MSALALALRMLSDDVGPTLEEASCLAGPGWGNPGREEKLKVMQERHGLRAVDLKFGEVMGRAFPGSRSRSCVVRVEMIAIIGSAYPSRTWREIRRRVLRAPVLWTGRVRCCLMEDGCYIVVERGG